MKISRRNKFLLTVDLVLLLVLGLLEWAHPWLTRGWRS